MRLKDRHNMIQCLAKEQKSACLVSGYQTNDKLLQGPEMYKFMLD